MYERTPEPRIRRITIIRISALLLAVIASYLAFARWPAGGATGDATSLFASTQPAIKPSIRLATFNIHSGIGEDQQQDLSRVTALLEGFDIVGLQETRGYFFAKPQVAELGDELQLNSLFAPTERTRFHDEFGNGLLTRLPVDSWERIRLPGTQRSHYRNVLIVRTRLGFSPLTVCITHIDRQTDRAIQLAKVWEIFAAQPPPAVLVGDFNTQVNDPLLAPFLNGAVDAVGSITPESKPPRIDWIFTRGLKTVAGGIRENDASDHPMVWAELSLPAN